MPHKRMNSQKVHSMTRSLCTLAFMVMLFAGTGEGQWISIRPGLSSAQAPTVTLLQDDGRETVVRIDVAGFAAADLAAKGVSYTSVDLLTDAFTNEDGRPEVPYVPIMIAIPDRGTATAEVVETGDVHTFSGYTLPPARPTWQEGAPEPEYVENGAVYRSSLRYPEASVMLDDPVVFRDFRTVRVSILPVRYMPASQELQVASSVTIRLTYGSDMGVNPRTSPKHAIPPSFAAVYRNSILNYQSVLDREYGGLETGREVLLMIVPDAFAPDFQSYKQWKHKSGTHVRFTKFSEIGANSTNPDIIRNYVAQCYQTWQNPPTYVLLGGDYGYVPIKNATGQSFANDDYFVEVDGDDVFPEAYVGRFTNSSNTELQTIANKVIKYERTPYRVSTDWFKHAVVCANNQYPTQPDTKRWVSDVMKTNGGFTVDTLLNAYGGSCVYNLTQVISAINNGRSYLNYRGEGSSSGWWASCYPFNTTDVSSVNNGERLTFVTSIGCGVANFAVSGSNCFGEQWMELGTPTSTRGSVAFLGPTWGNTHTKYNNAIDKGLYVAMFQEGIETPGPALLRGKIRMYNLYGGGDPYVLWHFRAYTTLGDPSTHIWRDIPRAVTVVYTPHISIGYDQVQVSVEDSVTKMPVAGAEITIASDSVYVTGVTDATGTIALPIAAPRIDTLTLLVRGVSVFPVEGTIYVTADQEHVAPFGTPTTIDIGGNQDGKINPNEDVEISYVLKNWGAQSSSNVQATLAAADTTYARVVNAGPVEYGTLLPNASGSGSGTPLRFFVKPATPIGTRIALRLNISSSSRSWSYTTYENIVGCTLEYVSTVVDDNGSSRHNGRLDPGETALLYITITNTGEDIAQGVSGTLHSDDPYISILDPSGSFGTIPIGGSGASTGNFFVVSVSSSCPMEYTATFALDLNTQGGLYPYRITRTVTLSIGLPTGNDPTGPDAYGYYAFASDDTLYDQAPKYDWVEIRSVGTRVPYVSPGDFTVTTSLPFVFKYYQRNFSNVRVSSDGWMAFGSGTQTSFTNYSLPHVDAITNMVAPFWDDLFEGSSNSTSKLLYYNDAINHRFIVEWDSVGHYGTATTLRESFQVILLDPNFYPTPTGDGDIIFQYRIVGEEGSCTVGVEDSTQTIGLQYLYNSTYASSATDIRDGLAIRWTTHPPTSSSTTTMIAVPMTVGWNLVSNPVLRPDSLIGVRRLFPHATTEYAFQYVPGSGYIQSISMPRGPGFWVKYPDGELNFINGIGVASDTISVVAGWNLFGSISHSVDTAAIVTIPPGITISRFFGFSGAYQAVPQIVPGKAYWVKLAQSGLLILTSSSLSMNKLASHPEDVVRWNELTITDANGHAQTLRFAADEEIVVDGYSMPPLPPQGVFDARFESADGGTSLQTYPERLDHPRDFSIAVQTTAYPLTVSWTILDDDCRKFTLSDAAAKHAILPRSITGQGSARIENSETSHFNLRVEEAVAVPTEFALYQNYPNPFNPVTSIRFAVPFESRVSLSIYNLLGQKVRLLSDNNRETGYHIVQWNGLDDQGHAAGSGVYFVRMEAVPIGPAAISHSMMTFTAVRKVLMIK
jgi:hypothetical protein